MENDRTGTISNTVSKDLQPIYRAKTATKAVNKAIEIVANSTPVNQAKLLDDPAFTGIVSGALNDLDQRKNQGITNLLDSFDKSNRPEASRFFSQEDS